MHVCWGILVVGALFLCMAHRTECTFRCAVRGVAQVLPRQFAATIINTLLQNILTLLDPDVQFAVLPVLLVQAIPFASSCQSGV